jgi:uncharacterized DUF497 family protein
MTFEFDPEKSKSNLKKHGIDFHDAQYLWLDPDRIIVPARTSDKARFLLVARLSGVFWSVIYTLRGEQIRIISVRKSRQNEKEIYQR